jgi:hypothetical protein
MSEKTHTIIGYEGHPMNTGERKKTITIKKRNALFFGLIITLVLFWFLGVDKSYIKERCITCEQDKSIIQYRLFSIPIYEKSFVFPDIRHRIAEDMGSSCLHDMKIRWHKYRWWGLCIRQGFISNEPLSLHGDDLWYNEETVDKLKNAILINPSLKEEFRERVIHGRDWNYWHRFQKELIEDDVEQIALKTHVLSQERIRSIVNDIDQIRWVDLKDGNLQFDENASLIFILDDLAGPFLIENIMDERPSKWLSWAKVGDVAHILLTVIHNRNWPTEEFEKEYGLEWNDPYFLFCQQYLNSSDNINKKGVRKQLQEAWQKCYNDSAIDIEVDYSSSDNK